MAKHRHPEALFAWEVPGGCAELYQSYKPAAIVSRRKAYEDGQKDRALEAAERQAVPVPLGLQLSKKQLKAQSSYYLFSVIWLVPSSHCKIAGSTVTAHAIRQLLQRRGDGCRHERESVTMSIPAQ